MSSQRKRAGGLLAARVQRLRHMFSQRLPPVDRRPHTDAKCSGVQSFRNRYRQSEGSLMALSGRSPRPGPPWAGQCAAWPARIMTSARSAPSDDIVQSATRRPARSVSTTAQMACSPRIASAAVFFAAAHRARPAPARARRGCERDGHQRPACRRRTRRPHPRRLQAVAPLPPGVVLAGPGSLVLSRPRDARWSLPPLYPASIIQSARPMPL